MHFESANTSTGANHDHREHDLIGELAAVLRVSPNAIDEYTSFETIEEWDSLRAVELGFMLEQVYGISLSERQMDALTSVADVRAVLAAHGINA